ncbi:acyl-CoA thioesterase-2 [Saccharopolyspora lacisalsi]|uniref:Acyl-CoA thioesterase-2 n=1 Tax=Halosaccharopolyspora lacisalsi TaxID=1000566 RepID=A0A839E6H5_9PSEU|nr:acyl-CoA thioesterase domain-containing protein [Halosaccharopolyspora lacisalsi]MBA8826488.1 acyl-CoA thioesterase-2 [Halosaccharopolyspora lacisalsi]
MIGDEGRVSASGPTLLELLDLEELDRDLYRAGTVFDDPFALYGGQVAAQALLAAGSTVPRDRLVHSLHGYYLRPGNASQPTIFRVDRDRDGGSFSSRRVVATQDGEVVFSMSCSFHRLEPGLDREAHPAAEVAAPEDSCDYELPRLFSMRARLPPQPYPDARWPTRFWSRCALELPKDPLLHSCVLTYLSDISSGSAPLGEGDIGSGPSLDHAVWFHRQATLDDWVLMDLQPQTVAAGRGWYTGTMRSRTGELVASLTQETLFRAKRPSTGESDTSR